MHCCCCLYECVPVNRHCFFLQHLRLSAKVRSKDTEFTLPSAFTNTKPPPLLPSCTTVTHLLQSVNQHWHIIISQSLWFTFGFILDIVYSIGFDKCIMTYVHYYSIIQSSFRIKKNNNKPQPKFLHNFCSFGCSNPPPEQALFTVIARYHMHSSMLQKVQLDQSFCQGIYIMNKRVRILNCKVVIPNNNSLTE